MSLTDHTYDNNTCIIYPIFHKSNTVASAYRMQETTGLAESVCLRVVYSECVFLRAPNSSTLFGKGVLDRMARNIEEKNIGVCIVDGFLSPVQQRNLERTFSIKFIDRTWLILEIFAKRARTFEGKLQVELATLMYQKSRLVRAWTHLERQRGGGGFVGGPGESQLEIDRRLADVKITKTKRILQNVKCRRELHRSNRQKIPYPTVALVGYTNAGKSTLFNRLTGANVQAKNRLFCTLDPTMRGIKLKGGTKVIVSDTVGFISSLPHHLIAAFKATLEEVVVADIIIHVRDLQDSQFVQHGTEVESILEKLGISKGDKKIVEVWNKVDTLTFEEKISLENLTKQKVKNSAQIVLCSALKEQNLDILRESIEKIVRRPHKLYELELPVCAGSQIAWIYSKATILQQKFGEKRLWFQLEMAEKYMGKLRKFLTNYDHKITEIR